MTVTDITTIPAITHHEAMALRATELDRAPTLPIPGVDSDETPDLRIEHDLDGVDLRLAGPEFVAESAPDANPSRSIDGNRLSGTILMRNTRGDR